MGLLEDVREVLRGLRRREPGQKFCPKCGAPLQLSSRFDIWFTPEKYVCKKCGYWGPIAMELERASKREEQSKIGSSTD